MASYKTLEKHRKRLSRNWHKKFAVWPIKLSSGAYHVGTYYCRYRYDIIGNSFIVKSKKKTKIVNKRERQFYD